MDTSVSSILSLAARLIDIPSVTEHEHQVVDYLRTFMRGLGWEVESLPVRDGRENIFVSFGSPRVVFTTHLDVVPAPSHMMRAKIDGETLYGRGACDTKGIAATIIAVAMTLRERDLGGFGVLFVIGEEEDGCGATQAAINLQGRGIRYIVNGEPTQGKLMLGHKGQLEFEIVCHGKACHSGYPECGEDANAALLGALHRVRSLTFPVDPVFGECTLNVGLFQGGVAANVISPHASARCFVRTSVHSSLIKPLVWNAVAGAGEIRELTCAEPTPLLTLPGFETDVAAFFSDIPNFASLGAEALLYGPGDIRDAHTDHERITAADIQQAYEGYLRIFSELG